MKYYGFVPKTLREWAEKHSDIISEVSEEGWDGYWLYFNPGWIDEESGTHQIHEWTIAKVMARLKFIKKEEG